MNEAQTMWALEYGMDAAEWHAMRARLCAEVAAEITARGWAEGDSTYHAAEMAVDHVLIDFGMPEEIAEIASNSKS